MADVVRKIEFDELINSSTMFYVNDKYEEDIEKKVQAKVDELAGELQFIHSKEDLKKYIIEHKDALDNLTSLMEISTERFKRMVSMIRKDRGFVFSTEWGLRKIRTTMMGNPAMMESVLELLYDGRNDEKMKAKIPFFYLDNIGITEATLAKLQNKDSIRVFVKRGLEGKYSNNIGDLILEDIERKINQVCIKHGLDYEKNVRVPLLDRAVSFVLESPTDPKIIIDVSYSVTTSSSQGKRKNVARKTEATLKKKREKDNQIIYVNFLDGAGWIGRQADMKEIHRCSDYVINFNNLNQIEDIITSYVENYM